jgi:hypothetical protein
MLPQIAGTTQSFTRCKIHLYPILEADVIERLNITRGARKMILSPSSRRMLRSSNKRSRLFGRAQEEDPQAAKP